MWEELKTFTEVVEQNSFTKAAINLNISQPTVSMHIKRLEAEFNEHFILRSKSQKKLIITSAGEKFYEQAKKMLKMWENTKKYIKDNEVYIEGNVKIGASLTIGEYFLPEFLGIFNEKYPHINVHLELGNTKNINEMLRNYRIDIGIVEGSIVDEKFEKSHLYKDNLVIIAPKDHNKSDERWIIREPGSGTRRQWEDIIGNKISSFKYPPLVMNTNFAVKESVKSGIGIALISEYVAKRAVADGEVIYLDGSIEGSRYFDLVLHKERIQDKVMDVFCGELKEFFKNKQDN